MHVRIRISRLAAALCSLSIVPATAASALAQEQTPPPAAAPQEPAPAIPKDQLDSIVAPIALYPDPLLAQVLAASTYPLEIVQLQQWLDQHKDLKDQALIDAVQKENWDPSVQSMAVLPDAVKLLASDIKWTTDLGNAFLAQQSDVMEAVQRMRAKAQKNGTLKSNEKTKVETKTVEKQTVVVIEQADPQVVYVPTYNPTVVYGPPPYPYPVIAYPPPPPPGAYVATAAISFGVGVMVGAAFHGGYGYNCGWGGAHNNTVVVNHNNNFVKTSNVRAGGQPGAGRGQWQHNPQHRGGAPYGNQATASRYGGASPRDTSRAQQAGGDRQQAGGDRQQAGGDRQKAGGDRQKAGGDNRGAKQQPAGADRGGGGAESRADRGGGGAEPRAADRGATNSDRVGNRSDSPGAGGGGSKGGDALGGGSRGSYSGSDARSSSARGSSSAGARGGGGGGGRGGGGRGGGRR